MAPTGVTAAMAAKENLQQPGANPYLQKKHEEQ